MSVAPHRLPRLVRVVAAILAFASAIACARAAAGATQRDVQYGEAGGERLLLDVHVPDGKGPFPVAILVHGGGWSAGDKSGSEKPGSGNDIKPWFDTFSAGNFTWFSINYRLAPKHRWPACLEDVQTAIRWVKKHVAEYHGDPQHIALVGHSAGGHLVCLAATIAEDDTRVQAVVGYAPVTDFEADVVARHGLSTSLQGLFNLPHEPTPASLAILREASPIQHVKAGLPPFLLLHGDADVTVQYQQSLAFQRRLRHAGNRCDLLTIPGAPHGLLTWKEHAPNYEAQVVTWLRRTFEQPQ